MLAAAAAIAALGLGGGVRQAQAATTPVSTDVMFVFDTSASMTPELTEAKERIQTVMSQLAVSLPNVAFGVSRVEDVPYWTLGKWQTAPPPPLEAVSEPDEKQFEEDPEKAWELLAPISTSQSASLAAVDRLTPGGGGDAPEAYSRALWEADSNPNVGWRVGAMHEIVLIADNVPHDPNLNEGIAAGDFAKNEETSVFENPFDTFTEAEGKLGIRGTRWVPGTNLEIVQVARKLAADGKPLESVEYRGEETGYLHYWEYWAGVSGGRALNGGTGELAGKLTSLIETGACGSSCPHPTSTQVTCGLLPASASDTCVATVADTDPAGATNPTGTVTLTSLDGGSFPAGGTCTLTSTAGSTSSSSCSVGLLPPSAAVITPAMTSAYSGDGGHRSSSGSNSYPTASELAKDITLTSTGTIHQGVVELPVSSRFPFLLSAELLTGPGLADLASAAGRAKAPKLLGRGTLKLRKAGRGRLLLRLANGYKGTLDALTGRVHLTVRLTIKTLAGALVVHKSTGVTLSPRRTQKG